MARYMRTYGKSTLRPPVVVAIPALGATAQTVARVELRPRRASWALRGPVVIFPAIAQIGPPVSLAPSRRGRFAISTLQPPTVLATPFAARPVKPQLARVPPRRLTSWLRRPTVIFPALVQIGPPVVLAPKPRPGRPRTLLRPPLAVVAVVPVIGQPIETQLVRVPARRTLVALRGPVIVDPAGFVQIGPPTYVAYSRRGAAKSALRPPSVVGAPTTPAPSLRLDLARTPPRTVRSRLGEPLVVGTPPSFRGPGVKLAPLLNQRSSVAHTLRSPAVVTAAFVAEPVATRIIYSHRGETVAHLYPPTVVTSIAPTPQLAVNLAYSLRGKPASQLAAPVAVEDGIAFGGPAAKLASISDRKQPVWSQLAAPAVVAVATLAPPLRVTLTRLPLPRKTRARLTTPVVVGAPTAFRGPGVRLATPLTTRRPVRHVLAPPAAVISNAPFAPIQATLTYSRRGAARSRLTTALVAYPPFAPLSATLTYSRRGVAKPRLRGPVVIGGSVAFRGPGVRLTAPANSRALVRHLLQPPAVVVSIAPFAPLTLTLAYSRRGKPVSQLTAPPIVGATVAFHGPGVRLVAPSDRRAPVAHRLAAPTLVTPAAFSTPATFWLAPSRVARAHGSRLAPPTLIGGRIAYHGPGVKLVAPQNSRQPVRTRLAAPTVVTGVAPNRPTQTTLAPSSLGRPISILSPPAAIGGAVIFHGPGVRLTAPANTRRPVRHALAAPTVITPIAVAYHGPGVRVASISNTRRPVAHRLSPPTVLNTPYHFRGPGVRLAGPVNGRQRVAHRLAPPTILAVVYAFHGPGVRLANPLATKRPVRHTLGLPVVVEAGIAFFGPSVSLVRSPAGQPRSTLTPPAAIAAGISYGGPRVRLVNPINSRSLVQHRLGAPSLVRAAEAFYGPTTSLTPGRAGRPSSTLQPPVVVGAGIAYHGPRVKLIPLLNRRAPIRGYRLTPPTVVQPVTLIFFGPLVTLAPPSRGKPVSRLSAPAVVGAGVYFRAVLVALAPSSRGAAKPLLSPPTVVGTVAFRSITVTLAPSRRVRTRSLLRPPALVRLQPFRQITVKFARIRPARVRSILRAALLPPPNRGQQTLRVKLAQPTRRRTIVTLAPPALIGGGIVYRPVQTHLARIVHPPVNRMLGAPTVIILISACHGYAGDHSPGGGFITDTSECADGETGDHTDAGGMIQDTGQGDGYAGDHPQAGGYVTDTGG